MVKRWDDKCGHNLPREEPSRCCINDHLNLHSLSFTPLTNRAKTETEKRLVRVCKCQREREGERERDVLCVCVYVCLCVHVCALVLVLDMCVVSERGKEGKRYVVWCVCKWWEKGVSGSKFRDHSESERFVLHNLFRQKYPKHALGYASH